MSNNGMVHLYSRLEKLVHGVHKVGYPCLNSLPTALVLAHHHDHLWYVNDKHILKK